MATVGDPGKLTQLKPNMTDAINAVNAINTLSALTRPTPWYHSGVALLAGLSWVSLYTTLFLLMLGVVEPDRISGGSAVVFFVMAVLCSLSATGRGFKRQ